ncbi:Uncharacterised protein [Shigella sonnei]|nr:Uncharacterised protein [Shigella sonnei]
MGFYGAPDKKRHLTMARLELLFVNVKHGGIGRHVINNLATFANDVVRMNSFLRWVMTPTY